MKISRRKQPRKGKRMSGNKTLTLGSLFDGSGSFPFGGILAGIEPKWNSEIEPFPVLVTHKRLPQVKHYGDVSGKCPEMKSCGSPRQEREWDA